MNFYDLPLSGKAFLLTVAFMLFCIGVYCFMLKIERKKIWTGVLILVCCVLDMTILALYASNMYASLQNRALPAIVYRFSELPLYITAGFLVILSVAELLLLREEYRYHKNSITHTSIKEGFDHLSTGLCFYRPDGMVMLVNYKMVQLGFALVGEEIQNGIHFWDILRNGDMPENVKRLSNGEIPEFQLPDGSIWSFRKELLDGVIQLIAADTTQLHYLMEQLKEENRNLEAMCRRIRDYGDQVEQYVIARERLETRVNLHSLLGQGLLMTRHYLQYKNGDVNRILEMWQRHIEVLKMEVEPQHEMDSFSELKANARVVGMEVITTGVQPADSEIQRLLAAAGVEAVINAGKHADAKTVRIEIQMTDHGYTAVYTNDGKAPSGNIAEGGGLSSLRMRVERAGGTMEIVSIPQFVMIIKLGKEV